MPQISLTLDALNLSLSQASGFVKPWLWSPDIKCNIMRPRQQEVNSLCFLQFLNLKESEDLDVMLVLVFQKMNSVTMCYPCVEN